jgi:hypothetical protein
MTRLPVFEALPASLEHCHRDSAAVSLVDSPGYRAWHQLPGPARRLLLADIPNVTYITF